MSSFLVSTDHIDYMVSALVTYAPESLAGREPDDVGRTLLAENAATVTSRWIGEDGVLLDLTEGEEIDQAEMEQILEDREAVDALVAAYRYRPVADVDPAQAVHVARCWQYQRGRQGWDDHPGSWRLADALVAAALAHVPDDGFSPGGRSEANLRTELLAWNWRR